MATRGRGARIKGAQFERDIANLLTEKTGIEFKRGLAQTRGGGSEVADVTAPSLLTPVHFELKRQQRCNIKGAYAQAVNDAPPKAIRVIVTKEDRSDTLVTMELSQWIEFFNAWLTQNK
jgi:hypothetical protein